MDEENFNVAKVLDSLMSDVMSPKTNSEIDKAMADVLLRGAGYMRFTQAGVEHIPFDRVRISPDQRIVS